MDSQRQQRIEDLGYDYIGRAKAGVEACNLCGSSEFVTIAHRDRYGFPQRADACVRCGLVFLNPLMTPAEYREFYSRTYRPLLSAYYGRRVNAETIQQEQSDYADHLASVLEPHAPKGRHLDVGGSTGVVARRLADRFGLESTVLDPSPDELRHAKELGLETIAGLLEDVDPGTGYDLISVCQTVDHLLDVASAMVRLRRLMTDSTLLFIDIVDFRAGYLRNWSIEETIKIDHPYYLTESTIEAYLVRFGYRVLDKDYAPDHLHVGYVCRAAAAVPDAKPSVEDVRLLLREIRTVQNPPKGAALP